MTTGGYDPNRDPQGPPPGNYPPPSQGNYPPPQGNYPPPSQGGYPPPTQGNYPPPSQGGYPPPQGNYPPPSQGGYPPPPGEYGKQGGYGNEGGYGQQGGFGQQGVPGAYPTPPPFNDYGNGGPGTLSVGAAISYGWNRYKSNWPVWVGIALIFAVISGLLNYVSQNSDSMFVRFVFAIVAMVASTLIQAAMIRGALHEVDGVKPVIASFFQFANVVPIILASILVGVLTGIGFVLLIVPGLVIMFFTWWTLQFVIDRDESPITALVSSAKAIASNGGTVFLLALALVGINIVGFVLLLVGLLVTIPLTLIASTYAYRVTTGGRVA